MTVLVALEFVKSLGPELPDEMIGAETASTFTSSSFRSFLLNSLRENPISSSG
jgi:hypothetical protein